MMAKTVTSDDNCAEAHETKENKCAKSNTSTMKFRKEREFANYSNDELGFLRSRIRLFLDTKLRSSSRNAFLQKTAQIFVERFDDPLVSREKFRDMKQFRNVS